MNDSICIDSVKLRAFLHEYNRKANQFFGRFYVILKGRTCNLWDIGKKRVQLDVLINNFSDSRQEDGCDVSNTNNVPPGIPEKIMKKFDTYFVCSFVQSKHYSL